MEGGGAVVVVGDALAPYDFQQVVGKGVFGNFQRNWAPTDKTLSTRLQLPIGQSLVADVPAHPALVGTSGLTALTNIASYQTPVVRKGSTLIAHWTNGQPLVIQRGKVIELNMFAWSALAGTPAYSQAQTRALFLNTMYYLACTSIPAVAFPPPPICNYKPQVALLFADDSTTAEQFVRQNTFLPSGMFANGVNVINWNTQYPSAVVLQPFKALFVWTNQDVLTSPVGGSGSTVLGNVLAEYIANGGGVVLGGWGLSSTEGTAVFGNYASTWAPTTKTGAAIVTTGASAQTLVADMPNHPILVTHPGVEGFAAVGPTKRQSPLAVRPGSIQVAHWSGGDPLIVVRNKVVELNFFARGADTPVLYTATAARNIITNSMLFAACAPPPECVQNTDCNGNPNGGACSAGVCVACAADSDCNSGSKCTANQCVPLPFCPPTPAVRKVALLFWRLSPSTFITQMAQPGIQYTAFDPSVSWPTAADLIPFDAVYAAAGNRFLITTEATDFGNLLADYITGNPNGIVVIDKQMSTSPLTTPTGRWVSGGYNPVTTIAESSAVLPASTLVADIASSPLLAGVSSMSVLTAGVSRYNLNAVKPGATLVAHWSDGTQLVATLGRVVSLNFIAWQCVPASQYTSSCQQLILNAFKYVPFECQPPECNVNADCASGTCSAGVCIECQTNSDCSSADQCTANKCVPRPPCVVSLSATARSVAVISPDAASTINGQLTAMAHPKLTYTVFSLANGASPPSLSTLLQYQSVLVYANGSPSSGQTLALGNTLADYVDAGGVVVFDDHSLTGSSMLSGRFPDYYPSTMPSPGAISSADAVGKKSVADIPTSALLTGVTSVSVLTQNPFQKTVSRPGTTVHAHWDTTPTYPLVSSRGNVIEVNAWFIGCTRSSPAVSADCIKLFTNALLAVPCATTCAADFDCSGNKVCNSGSCVQCVNNGHCSQGNQCTNNLCVPKPPCAAPLSSAPRKVAVFCSDTQAATEIMTAKFTSPGSPGLTFTVFGMTGVNQAPSLSTLSQYQAVLVFVNGAFNNPSLQQSFGDVLADYIDTGGIVLVDGHFMSQPNTVFTGRLTEYYASNLPAGTLQSSAAAPPSAGRALIADVPSSPLLANVDGLKILGNYNGMYYKMTAREGGTVLAHWPDSTPLLSTKGGLVEVNMWFAGCFSNDGMTHFTPQCQTLFYNALRYVPCAPECSASSPCAAGKVCHSGACVQCSADSDCSAGSQCSNQVCIPLPPCSVALSQTTRSVAVIAVGPQSAMDSIVAPAMATPGLTFTMFGVTGTGSPPSLLTLSAFDAILVFGWSGFNSDSYQTELGDILADYIDTGGGIVMFDSHSISQPNYALQGRFASYYPSNVPAGTLQQTASAGNSNGRTLVADVLSSGLLKNTAGLSIKISENGMYQKTTTRAGATVVAHWNDAANTPLISTRGAVVEVNMWFWGCFMGFNGVDAFSPQCKTAWYNAMRYVPCGTTTSCSSNSQCHSTASCSNGACVANVLLPGGSSSGAVSAGGSSQTQITVPPGAPKLQVVIATGGSGSNGLMSALRSIGTNSVNDPFDVYLQVDGMAGPDSFVGSALTPDGDTYSITVANPVAGQYFIGVFGSEDADGGSFSVSANLEAGCGPACAAKLSSVACSFLPPNTPGCA
eukprot:TRINITY_DN4298_c0_g1_i1.p1 TRINITY_DN4298_c0_g1~~TRINITY_DN4298_c0_g1_i1.p1  ORF type:complete len:1770 (-),score=420.92 TRINITY_DN4298_c0_g1_i1:760-5685(-)